MIILTHRFGRLGNRLLITAHLMAYALETGHTLMDWGFAEYTPYFIGTAQKPDVFQYPTQNNIWNSMLHQVWVNRKSIVFRATRKLLRTYPRLKSQIIQNIPEEPGKHWGNPLLIDNLVSNKVLWIESWYVRAPRCFIKHQQSIRECFTPLPIYQQKISEFLQPLREHHDVIVGLHIRAGDYRIYGGFYELELWRIAMERMVDQLPGKRVVFIICSDEDFRDQIDVFSGFDVRFGLGHIIEDLYTLAQCDYIIAPQSTYSNWAAFYGQVPIYHMSQSLQALTLEQFRRITYFVDHRIDP